MIIRYADGKSVEGVLLARSEKRLRVALKGSDDVTEFNQVDNVWVAEDCEPVQIEYAWQTKSKQAAVTEADCLCSHELASHLIRLLLNGEAGDSPKVPTLRVDSASAGHPLVM